MKPIPSTLFAAMPALTGCARDNVADRVRAGSVVFLDGPGRSVGTGVLGADKMTLTVEK